MESSGETPRRHLPGNLVEELPVRPQLFRLQKYGNFRSPKRESFILVLNTGRALSSR